MTNRRENGTTAITTITATRITGALQRGQDSGIW
jgi:hypothetical protein